MINTTDFKIRFPEFTTTSDALIQILIDEAYLTVTDKFGKYQDTAVLYFTAHTLNNNLKGEGKSAYGANSKSVDGVSISYAIPTAQNDMIAYFQSSGYGQKYLYYFNIVKVGQAIIV